MKRFALAIALVLTLAAFFGCSAKKTDSSGKTLLGGAFAVNAVDSPRSGGKSLDIDAGVTVLGTEFGFVTSANGSYIKGVRGMDPTLEGALPKEQVYDPMADPEPPAPGETAPQAAPKTTP